MHMQTWPTNILILVSSTIMWANIDLHCNFDLLNPKEKHLSQLILVTAILTINNLYAVFHFYQRDQRGWREGERPVTIITWTRFPS